MIERYVYKRYYDQTHDEVNFKIGEQTYIQAHEKHL